MIVFDPLERTFWIIAIVALFLCGIIYLDSGRKNEVLEVKKNVVWICILGFGFFLFCR